jgi:hypothetical protein
MRMIDKGRERQEKEWGALLFILGREASLSRSSSLFIVRARACLLTIKMDQSGAFIGVDCYRVYSSCSIQWYACFKFLASSSFIQFSLHFLFISSSFVSSLYFSSSCLYFHCLLQVSSVTTHHSLSCTLSLLFFIDFFTSIPLLKGGGVL